MSLLAVGSVALDSLEGPFGRVSNELGGSALYFALAASLVAPVEICAPVGKAELPLLERALDGRDIDLGRLSVLDRPSYRWSARQEEGSNRDLGSQDTIYDDWQPNLPADHRGWAFIGSMRPDKQALTAVRLAGCGLLAGDSMQSYVRDRPAQAQVLLRACDWFFGNEEEIRALGGDPAAPQPFASDWGLDGLVIKAGPNGCSAWTAGGELHLPAVTAGRVVDVTGAGDALAGGMLARWMTTGGRPDGLADALLHGVACAALAISDVGLAGLTRATPDRLEELVQAGRPAPPVS